MSTYLVAFVVCDFKVLQSGTFGTWAREGSLKSAKYALEIGPQILNYYQKFFQIKYPLPKMDMIAIPDFAAGTTIFNGYSYRMSTQHNHIHAFSIPQVLWKIGV